jgi:hypothetical protein
MNCPYCEKPVELVSGKQMYPHMQDLKEKLFYRCEPCDAHVGCYPNTDKPLGRLANKELRKWKISAHAAFDPLWKFGRLSRTEAYARLAKSLGIRKSEAHIGMFDVPTCQKVVEICRTAVTL